MTRQEEGERLREILDAEEVHPTILESGLSGFSEASKDDLVSQIARAAEPPSARLLARLPSIVTAANREEMRIVFLRNLQAPQPTARKASLYGLDRLGDPNLPELAVQALADPDDLVVAAACDLLLRRSQLDTPTRELLRGVYASHLGDEGFRSTLGLLEAHGIRPTEEP
jgi:HEAT repeat protein